MQKTILVVDDEPDNIKAILGCLRQSNYKVFVAADGKTGYDIALSTMPDLIIMDWDMPKQNGIESIKLLKQNEKIKDIPIIMATGKMLHVNNLKVALEAGAVDYIRKPVDETELIARINSMILLHESMKRNIEFERKIRLQEEKELNYIIEQKMRELACSTLKLIQLSQFKNELIPDIKEVNKHTNPKGKELLLKIISKIKSGSSVMFWEEFEISFSQVHPAFYFKLTKQFPDITTNDKRLCAFMLMNLTTKEIADILQKSARSIEIARTRLRVKLGLKGINTNINTFLTSI